MEIHKKLKTEDLCVIFTDTMVHIQIQLECIFKKKWRDFPIKLKVFL